LDASEFIRAVPDAPAEGEVYYDLSPLLTDADGFATAVAGFVDMFDREIFDAVVCTSSYAGMIGTAVAEKLGKPVVPATSEPSPVPCDSLPVEGKDACVRIPAGSVREGMKVVIIADVLATGRTTKALIGLVEKLGGKVVRIGYIAEISKYGARKAKVLRGYPFEGLVAY